MKKRGQSLGTIRRARHKALSLLQSAVVANLTSGLLFRPLVRTKSMTSWVTTAATIYWDLPRLPLTPPPSE